MGFSVNVGLGALGLDRKMIETESDIIKTSVIGCIIRMISLIPLNGNQRLYTRSVTLAALRTGRI